jgi:hypothetical protein
MNKKLMLGVFVLLLALAVPTAYALESSIQPTGLLLFKQGKALDGLYAGNS